MSFLAATDLSIVRGGRAVLGGVSATFRAGEVTAVLGPNGAGKSTLLTALAGLLKPDAGKVALGEASLQTLSATTRARRIGYLPQTPEVAWPLQVRALISLGLIPFAGAHESAIDAALETANLQDLANRTVDTLSGGERGRVLLARALVGDPEWLLADEPLAGLDPGHALETAAILKARAAARRGVILTLHDLTTAWRIADRVIVLDKGEIVADGPPTDALTPDILARVYAVSAHIVEGPGGGHVDIIGPA